MINLNKEIAKIESALESMKAKLDVLQEKIDKREDSFMDKSEKWQESEKGIEFEEKTSLMLDQHCEIESLVDDIENALFSMQEHIEASHF